MAWWFMFMAFMLRHVNYAMIHVQGFHVASCRLRETKQIGLSEANESCL